MTRRVYDRTAREIASHLFRGRVSHEWVRRHCRAWSVLLSPRKRLYDTTAIRAWTRRQERQP